MNYINKHSLATAKQVKSLKDKGMTNRAIAKEVFGTKSMASTVWYLLSELKEVVSDKVKGVASGNGFQGAKVLTFDIETAPVLGHVWSLWNNNLGLNQIEQDWYVLSYAAKWMHEDTVIYEDQRNATNIEDDKELLEGIWKLLDEADIVITQNGKKFDSKKLNARFVINGMKPPSSYRHIDTLLIAKEAFAFTSNKLEYMTDKLCTKYKKLKHANFSGFELWKQCLAGNPAAWEEMEEYNIYDVLSLEELFFKLAPWSKKLPNLNLYRDDHNTRCLCGCERFTHNGYAYTNLSKFDKFRCDNCGAEIRGRINLLSKEKRKSLKANVAY